MFNRSMQNTPFTDRGEELLSVPLPVAHKLHRQGLNAPVTLVYGPALLLLLAACGGGSGGSQPEPVVVDLSGSMAEGVYILKDKDGQARAVEITSDMDAVAIDKALTSAGIRTNAEDGTTVLGSDIIAYYPDAVLNPAGDLPPADDMPDDDKTIAIYTGTSNGQTVAGTTNLFLAAPGANTYLPAAAVDNVLSYAYAPAGIDIDLTLRGSSTQNSPEDRASRSWAHGDSIGRNVNHIIGSDHRDSISGDEQDNVVEGRGGPDILDGRAGTDALSFVSSDEGVTVSLTTGTGTGGHAEGDTYTNFENIIGSSHHDTLTGSPDTANSFTGGSGADSLHGGDETGDGVTDEGDRAVYSGSEAGVTVNLNDGERSSGGEAEGDVLTAIEHVIGSDHDDTFVASADANKMDGGTSSRFGDTASYAASQSGVSVNLSGMVFDDGLAGFTGSPVTATAGTDSFIILNSAGGFAAVADLSGLIQGEFVIAARLDSTGAIATQLSYNGENYFTSVSNVHTLNTAAGALDAAGVAAIIAAGISGASGGAAGDVLTGIENLTGSAFADTLIGDDGDNVIESGGIQAGTPARAARYDGAINLNWSDARLSEAVSGAATASDVDVSFSSTQSSSDGNGGISGITQAGGGFGDDIDVTAYSDGFFTLAQLADALNNLGPSFEASVDEGREQDTWLENMFMLQAAGGGNAPAAEASASGLTFTAKTAGTAGNYISVNIVFDSSGADSDGDPAVAVTGAGTQTDPHVITLTVDDAASASLAALKAAIEGHTGSDSNLTYAADLVAVTVAAGKAEDLFIQHDAAPVNLAGGVDGGAAAELDIYGLTIEAAASAGAAGNDIQVKFVHDATATDPVTAETDGDDDNLVVVTLGTDGATLAQIQAALNDVDDPSNAGQKLLSVALNDPQLPDGTTEVDTDAAAVNLAGGADAATRASVTLNGLTFTAVTPGTGGNSLSVEFAYDASITGALVSVASTNEITITLGSGGASLTEIATVAFAPGTAANALVSVAVTPPGSGGNILRADADFEDTMLIPVQADDSPDSDDRDEFDLTGGTEDTKASVTGPGFTLTAKADGAGGNAVTVTFDHDASFDYTATPSGVEVDVSGTAVTVTLGDNGANLSAIKTAIEGDSAATALLEMEVTSDRLIKVVPSGGLSFSMTGGSDAITYNDIIDGGEGNDTASYIGSSTGVNVNLSDMVFDAGVAAFSGSPVTAVAGTHSYIILNADGSFEAVADLSGLTQGKFVIAARLGSDGAITSQLSYSGTDYFTSSGAVHTLNTLVGQSAQEAITASGFRTTADGDADRDILTSIENLIGSAHADTLTGDDGDNIIEGGDGGDTLHGGGGVDTLSFDRSASAVTASLATGQGSHGEAAGDSYTGFENITGSDHGDDLTGDARANVIRGGAGADTLRGGDGNDTLYGGDGNDALHGEAGDDRFIGGAGADYFYGGAGFDTADYSGVTEKGVRVLVGRDPQGSRTPADPDDHSGQALGDRLYDIEQVIGSAQADILIGDDHNTVFEGGAGADHISGYRGTDTASYALSAASVNVHLGDERAESGGDAQGDVLTDIENLIGSDHDDRLTGDDKDNTITGGDGADTLAGGKGKDTASYAGADALNTARDVTIAVDSADGIAAATVAARDGVFVNLALGSTAQVTGNSDASGDVLTDIENLIGSDHGDVLVGDLNINILTGGAGDDYLAGGLGDDTLHGGGDADTLHGGSGNDTLHGNDGGDTLHGGDDNDWLYGEAGADTLDGGAGADNLYGGADEMRDTLTGEAGEDVFWLESVATDIDGADLIKDWGAGGTNDKLATDLTELWYEVDTAGSRVILYGTGNGSLVLAVLEGITTAPTLNDFDINNPEGQLKLTAYGSDGGLEASFAEMSVTVSIDENTDVTVPANAGVTDALKGAGITGTGTFPPAGNAFFRLQDNSSGDDTDDAGLFDIDRSSGAVTWKTSATAPDHETKPSYSFTIEYVVGTQVLATQAVTVEVTDLNDSAPVFASGAAVTVTVLDGIDYAADSDSDFDAEADVIYTATAETDLLDDEGENADTIVWTLGGTDAGSFDIDATTGAVTFKAATTPELGTKANYSFTITATTRQGESDQRTATQTVTVNVVDINDEAPVFTHANPDNVVKGQTIKGGADGLVIYRASATPDAGTLAYSLKADTGDASLFEIDAATGAVTFQADHTAGTVNGTDKASYSFTVVATATQTVPGREDLITSEEQEVTWTVDAPPADTAAAKTKFGGLVAGAITGENDVADTIYAGLGADNIDGGTGTTADTVSYRWSHERVFVTVNGSGSGGTAEGDQLTNIENLIGSDFNDSLTGDANANVLDGGAGTDTANYRDATATAARTIAVDTANNLPRAVTNVTGVYVNLNLTTQDATNNSHASGDTLINIENINGSRHSDVLVGDEHNNTMSGFGGDDVFFASGGSDRFNGGGGNASVTVDYSGITANTADWDAGAADADNTDDNDGITVEFSLQGSGHVVTKGDTGETDRLTSIGNIIGTGLDDTITATDISFANPSMIDGGAGNDVLTGTVNSNDVLIGGAGNDTLRGRGGDDTLEGGAGADILNGGASDGDTASYANAAAVAAYTIDADGSGNVGSGLPGDETGVTGVYVSLSKAGAQSDHGTEAAGDTLSGIENVIGSDFIDVLVGNAGNNRLDGGDGNDKLYGAAGNDELIGGAGDDTLEGQSGTDTLTGGTGNDIFVIADTATILVAADIITDFAAGDKLDISVTGSTRNQVWFNNNSDSGSTNATNDTSVNDLVLYADAGGSQFLAVILDYTIDPVTGIFEDSITVNTEIT